MTDSVTCEVADHVATITPNRPERRNARNPDAYARLEAAFRRARSDEEARCVIVTGAGPAFCSGDDVAGIMAGPDAFARHRPTPAAIAALECDKPVIAAVDALMEKRAGVHGAVRGVRRGEVPAVRRKAGMTVTRFAPSPTGRLHLGHAWSAILAHDLARACGGRFLLRIEDIDGTRSRPEHVAAIRDDLAWLGLAWDGEVVFQSQRLHLYAAALDRLRAADLLYPCFCTRAEIAAASLSAPHGAEPVYPGTCRGRAAPDLSRPHCWRLDMARAAARAGPLDWTDHGRRIAADPLAAGDVVLARKDAPASYHLAVTVDDAAQGVTDVVRGEDLFAATHVHRLLQALLDLPVPAWHHHPLLRDAAGRRLAKRHGAPALADLRAAGEDGRAIAARLRAGRLPNAARDA